MKKARRTPAKQQPADRPDSRRTRGVPHVASRGDDAMRPEYDFSGGVRGKHAHLFAPGCPVRVVVLAPDVADGFASARAVNAALRRVLRERQKANGATTRRPRRSA
jgi:hypothetical protein